MKAQDKVQAAAIFNGATPLLSVDAALPHLLTRGTASAPAATLSATPSSIRRPRRLWSREDGFTMAGGKR